MNISHKNIDIVFRDNNCLDEFRWRNENATLDETLQKALETFSIITALWLPEFWFVEFSDFNFGVPEGESKKISIPSVLLNPDFDQAARRIRGELENSVQPTLPPSLKSIQTSLHGWNRLILPANVKVSDDWQLVNTDNQLSSSYDQYSAPPFNGLESVWIQVLEMNPATHFSLVIEAVGDISLRTSLGISFFDPENDSRNFEEVIRGVKLKEWQKANQQFYHWVIASLQNFDWERIV